MKNLFDGDEDKVYSLFIILQIGYFKYKLFKS